MALTQQDLAAQMIAQFRLLDPSASAEIGTPERKIFDTVAQGLADSQVDLAVLQGALDLDAKYGSTLERFLSLFGFGRQKATYATGFVTFSRPTASNLNINIPTNTQVAASNIVANNQAVGVQFSTTFAVVLPAGSLSITVPIRCNVPGLAGNVPANSINNMVGEPILGIVAVTNSIPTSGGIEAEDDNSLKTRFRNTVFRNLAGTEDQFLALAVSTAYSSKATVVAPQRRYREYIQVPYVDDASIYDVDADPGADAGGGETGNGYAGQFTSALSTIPYSKGIYAASPVFVSNGRIDAGALVYREGVDFIFNAAPINAGDTYRLALTGLGYSTSDPRAAYQPNITFTNVLPASADPSVQGVRPGDVVLLEYSYVPLASRGDLVHNITNTVDVYVDGGNLTLASTILTTPNLSTQFTTNPQSRFFVENYRRTGLGPKRPSIRSICMPLFWQPVTSVPDQITIGTNTYYNGIHYWPVTDVSSLSNSVRSRSGIEWSLDVPGQAYGDPTTGPFTGTLITAWPAGSILAVNDYLYDRNVIDLQAALDAARQVTTDVVAHKATIRYFKLDITVMFDGGIPTDGVQRAVNANLQNFLTVQDFGTTIQLSDLLQVVHGVSGIDNARWSDVTASAPIRVYETDINGVPFLNATIDRFQTGGASPDIWALYISGEPTGGTITIVQGTRTATINYTPTTTAATIQTALAPLTGFVETVKGNEQTVTTGAGSANSNTVSWSAVPNAIGYRVYRGTGSGVENTYYAPGNVLTFIDTGAAGTAGTPPNTGNGTTVPGPIQNVPTTATTGGTGLAPATTYYYIITAILPAITATVTEDVRATPVGMRPVRTFYVTDSAAGMTPLPTVTSALTGGSAVFNNDFFLRDNELASLPSFAAPGDTVPGAIIRPRAQGTWTSSGH